MSARPTPPAGYAARAPTPADADAVAELLRATEVQDFGEAEAEAAEVAKDWEAYDLERDAVLVVAPDGGPAGYGSFFRRTGDQAIVDVYTHPRHQGRGVATYLLDELERRAGAVEWTGSGIAASNTAARAVLEGRGYRFVRRFWRMAIDLDRHPPAPAWPEGIVATRYLESDERAIWDAIEEAFAGHWEYRPEAFDDWRRRTVERPGFDPTLWVVAKEDGDVVGAALCRKQPRSARVDTLGVRPRLRRRGLGTAILLEALGELYRRGETRIVLNVDSENTTGATRIYERAGMRVTREIHAYEKITA